MNAELVCILAQIFASQARIVAMQASDAACEAKGLSPIYTVENFYYEANVLDGLAVQARNA